MSDDIQKAEESFFYILNSSGFTRNGDSFTKTVQGPSQTIIVNGQQMVQPSKPITIEFRYVGEGAVGDLPVYGFELLRDGVSEIVEYVYDSNEFHTKFYSFLV